MQFFWCKAGWSSMADAPALPRRLSPGNKRSPEELGLDAVVLVLDWLLGQPVAARQDLKLALREPLSAKQWAAVLSLRQGVRAWNSCGPSGSGPRCGQVRRSSRQVGCLSGGVASPPPSRLSCI